MEEKGGIYHNRCFNMRTIRGVDSRSFRSQRSAPSASERITDTFRCSFHDKLAFLETI